MESALDSSLDLQPHPILRIIQPPPGITPRRQPPRPDQCEQDRAGARRLDLRSEIIPGRIESTS